MRRFSFILLLISCEAFAWQVGSEILKLRVEGKQTGAFISDWCTVKSPCDAWAALMETRKSPYNPSAFPDEPATNINLGSVSCRRRFKGVVLLAHKPSGETQGFCQFPDKSLLSINVL
jgi:hypothetical protein